MPDPAVEELFAWIENHVLNTPGPDGQPPSASEQARRWERMLHISEGVLLTKQAECFLNGNPHGH